MEDTVPVIYGLEFQSRCLTSQAAETEKIKFLVGTQSLKTDNQIHLLEFDEETNSISKSVFRHPCGEVWHLASSPYDSALFSTCYNQTLENKAQLKAALWRLPPDDAGHTDDVSMAPPLQRVADLTPSDTDEVKCVLWQPNTEARQLVTVAESSIAMLDLEQAEPKVVVSSSEVSSGCRGSKLTCGAWNPHHSGTQVAVACEANIRVWDSRANTVVQTVDGAHSQPIRDLDWNPNRQYTLASCGDDGRARVWDVRKPATPLKLLADHSHWVWTVCYNRFHDQLLLTASSDSRVLLTNLVSLSSEPFGTLLEPDEDDEDEAEYEQGRAAVREDGVLQTYEEHEESVYCAEWSSADPWLFASLSYDGRVVVSRVPRPVKYAILL